MHARDVYESEGLLDAKACIEEWVYYERSWDDGEIRSVRYARTSYSIHSCTWKELAVLIKTLRTRVCHADTHFQRGTTVLKLVYVV
jgi:hypothetical protein